MKVTNRLNLPQPFVDAVKSNYTVKADEIRVSELRSGIRETILMRRYWDQLEEDVSDRIWAIFGTAVHTILQESQETDHQIKEARLKEKVRSKVITGQFDLYDAKTRCVIDYKTTSVWSIVFGDFEDWRRQLLTYAWALRKAGFEVTCGKIVAMLKDHSKSKARSDSNYPAFPVVQIHFNFTDEDFTEAEEWLEDRVAAFENAEHLEDDDLPVCTAEERWATKDTFAVMKTGRKSALRVLNSMAEAEQWMIDNADKKPTHIDTRKGEDKKCQDYCSVNQFCNYWQERLKEE